MARQERAVVRPGEWWMNCKIKGAALMVGQVPDGAWFSAAVA